MKSSISKIKDDYSNLKAILMRYDAKITDWKDELRLDGKQIEPELAKQSTRTGYYDEIRCELDIIMDELDNRMKTAKAIAIKRIYATSSIAYGERTIDKMAELDPNFQAAFKAHLEVKERYIKVKSIVERFQDRGYSLNNIIKARIAELGGQYIYNDE